MFLMFNNKFKYILILLMILIVSPIEAQRKRIQIQVNDKKTGKGIENITIRDKKTSETEGSTDVDGGVVLTLSVGQVLQFSGVGYEEIDVIVPNKESFAVELESKSYVIDEVSVTAKMLNDIKAEPELTVVGNTMYVKNLVTIATNLFEKNRRFVLQTYLLDVMDNTTTMMSPVVVDGDEYAITQKRMYGGDINKDPLTSFVDYSVVPKNKNSFYFTDSVSPVNTEHDFKVIFLYSIEDYKSQKWTKVDSISKGVINPLRFYDFEFGVKDITDPKWFPQPRESLLPTAGSMNLEFETGQAKINMNNAESADAINNLRNELEALDKDPSTTLKSFSINGTSSPDGDYIRNKELAESRMGEVSKIILSVLSRETRSFLSVSTNASVATWLDVYELMKKDGLDDKAEKVKQIIDKNPKDINVQGANMRTLDFYKDIISSVYLPKLRKVEYGYEYSQFRVMTDNEIEDLYKSEPEKIDRYGYSRLFESTSDTAQLRKFYNQSLSRYPKNNYLAANKLSCLNLKSKKYDPELLAPYVKQGAPQELLVNQIITCLKRREFAAADSVATYIPMNEETEDILATVELFNGKYDNAERLQAKGGLNEVLILLSRGLNDQALKKVQVLDGEEPINCYIRAVCHARNGEPFQATTFLRMACLFDDTLGEIASMDGDLKDVWDVIKDDFE